MQITNLKIRPSTERKKYIPNIYIFKDEILHANAYTAVLKI